MLDSNKMPIFEEEKSIKILRPIVTIKCDLCFSHPNFQLSYYIKYMPSTSRREANQSKQVFMSVQGHVIQQNIVFCVMYQQQGCSICQILINTIFHWLLVFSKKNPLFQEFQSFQHQYHTSNSSAIKCLFSIIARRGVGEAEIVGTFSTKSSKSCYVYTFWSFSTPKSTKKHQHPHL